MKRFIWLALAVMSGSSLAAADEPGIIGRDDRVPIDVADPPWQAVGQINSSGWRLRSMCTGTLIAPRIVVTAAHCLVTPWDRKPVPAHDIHFVAGVHVEKMAGHSVAGCVRFAPGAVSVPYRYNPDIGTIFVPLEAFINDIAVVVLKEDVPVAPVRPALSWTFEAGAPLMHGAYPAHRRFHLMADMQCSTLEKDRGLWFTNCDTYAASSGGPIFVKEEGEWRVGAVLVGHEGKRASIAWPLSQWHGLSLDPTCPPP